MFGRTTMRWIMVWLMVVMVCAAPAQMLARTPSTPVVLGSDEEVSPEMLQLQNMSKAFVAIGQRVRPTVVAIETKTKIEQPEIPEHSPFRGFFGDEFLRRFFVPPEGEQRGLGSGVIVSKEGYILTSNHVIRGTTTINVTLADGRTFEEAKVVGTDPLTDLAVVKIDVKGEVDLPVIRLGDSNQLEVGEIVLAIGNPFAQYNTMTQGIVSALGRKGLRFGRGGEGPIYQNFIQTDAAINPGNSGGALVNLRGELVGINTSIVTQSGGFEGIGFAIPFNMARDVMEDLINKGRVVRGYLGVHIQDVDSDMADALGLKGTRGALVGTVEKDGPADRAGIQDGDVVLEVDGQPIEEVSHLMMLVARMDPGTKAKVKLFRDGKPKDVVVTLGERPEKEAGLRVKPTIADKLGIEVQPLTDELAQRLGYEGEEGVVVSAVQPGSPAAGKDIRGGDLIQRIGRQRIRSIADYRAAMEELKGDKAVILLLKRGERSFFVALKVLRE